MKLDKYDELVKNFQESVDVDYGYNISNELTKFKSNKKLGFRTAGSQAELDAGDYLYEEMVRLGLDEVQKVPVKVDAWTFKKARLLIDNSSEPVELSAYPCQFKTDGWEEFDLVYLNKGTAMDYLNVDVIGKFVLVDINQRNDWWISYPALEAQLHGAAGIIAVQSESFAEISPDALNSNDSNGPKESVALSISQTHANILKNLIKKSPDQSIKIKLDVDSTIEENSQTYNICGQITGEIPDEYIIFSGHYDAYFDGFQDNASAVGLIFSVAKAMTDIKYKPRRTIVFTAIAAEEWGVVDSRYDWSTGAFQQLFHSNSNWPERGVLNLNFELAAYRHNEADYINSVPELELFLNEVIKHLPNDESVYPAGIKVYSPLTTWADDWSFSISGIPSLRNDFVKSDFNELHYHSQFDNSDTYHEGAFTQHIKNYGAIGIYASEIDYLPLDLNKSLDNYLKTLKDTKTHTTELVQLIEDIKSLYQELLNSPDVTNAKLKKVYHHFQNHFARLNWDEEQAFAIRTYNDKIILLTNALEELEKDDINRDKALDLICQIDSNHYARYFSPQVYQHFLYQTTKESDLKTWGTGRVIKHLDLSNIVHQLLYNPGNEARSEWIEITKAAIDHTKSCLQQQINQDNVALNELKELIKSLIK